MDVRQNPFFTLGATSRDDRRRVTELAEEKALLSDDSKVNEARTVITNPRKRIGAEIAWFPGIGPKRTSELLSLLESYPGETINQKNLPPLARANLLAASFVEVIEGLKAQEAVRWILELCELFEKMDVESTLNMLNEERVVSGFPNITDPQIIQEELEVLRRHYRGVIYTALDKLPPKTLVSVVTKAVDKATKDGTKHGPILLDDIVDNSFEVGAQEFLQQETENIRSLINEVRAQATTHKSEDMIEDLVSMLEQVVKNWDFVAQPIQVSMRSRGREHILSTEVANEIRELAVELFNEYEMLDTSQRLTQLQQEVFAEVDRVVERTEEDAATLQEIAENREQLQMQAEDQAEVWKRDITYEAELGLIFKDRLRISPEGVEWKGRRMSLDKIQRIRWGGTQHYVNGVPSGSTYIIFVGNESSGIRIQLNKQSIYTEFIERLWKAVGVRLLTEMLKGLRNGDRFRFGNAVVDDNGVQLVRKHLFTSDERIHCAWSELVIGSGAGYFRIGKQDEKKVAAELSYQDVDNVHILEAAMRVFWKQPSRKLSDLLN